MARRVIVGIGVVLALVSSVASACGSDAGASGSTHTKASGSTHQKASQPTGDAKLSNGFTLPSRNILCAWRPGGSGLVSQLHCDVESGFQPPLPKCPRPEPGLDRPPSMMVMTKAGDAGSGCTADLIAPEGRPTLEYGTVWRFHGILCLSQASGLVCVNQAGHGFFLSRERWTDF